MAKNFIYPNVGLLNADVTDGTYVSGTETFTSSASMTNEERLVDQSIGLEVENFDNLDAVRIDVNNTDDVDTMALYFNAAETTDIQIYGSNNGTAMGTILVNRTANFSANVWTVIDLGGTFNRTFWFIGANGGAIEGLTEVLIGNKYDFDVNPPVGDTEYDRPNVDIIKSYGDQEYANKRANLKREFAWKWEIPTAAMRTSLRALDTAVQKNYLKFIYDDETTKWWVRMSADSLKFKQVAFNYWETNVKLTQQLI